jgi:MYXO-CTERM domain-containing protein
MKIAAILVVAGLAAAANAQTWDSGAGLGWAIPDAPAPATSFTFNPTVFGSTVTQFDIFMSPVHTWRGDLRIELIDPSANVVLLYNREDSSGDFISGFFSDVGAALPTTGNLDSNASGSLYLPSAGTLSSLNATAGTWTLRVQDLAGADVGTIDRVRLTTVPTPGALALLGLGGLVAGRRNRR